MFGIFGVYLHYMKVIYNNILPLGRRFVAINLFGVLFVRKGHHISPSLLNHESIHTRQMLETGIVFFYVIYVVEWGVRLLANGFDSYGAYRHISFEREAYSHDNDLVYLTKRRAYAMWR